MRSISKKLSVWAVGILIVALFGMMACTNSGTGTGGSDAAADGTALSADGADPTSIMAVPAHAENGFTAESVAQVSTCATCHPYDSLVAAGAGKLVDPDSGTVANPHANHQYLDCTDCHSVQGQSVLHCNSYHEFALAEGWANLVTNAS